MDDSLVCLVRYNDVPTDAQAQEIRRILSSEHLNSKPTVRRRQLLILLTGTLSAIKRFPPEILIMIFLFCRDLDISSNEIYTTIHPNQAPMLLTRICSRWRQIALKTPRLWDNVRLQTKLFAKGGVDAFIADILRRSQILPLFITIDNPEPIIHGRTWLSEDTLNEYDDRWLDLLWTNPNTCLRLRSLTLDIFEDDYTPNMFPLPRTEFPALTNLALTMEGHIDPDLVQILDSFKHAPFLRSLKLVLQDCSDVILETTFHWHQLTTLNLSLPLTSDVAHAILVQCSSLEHSRFSHILECDVDTQLPPPLPHALLSELRDFEFEWGQGSQTDTVLGGLSLPRLRSLAISSSRRSSWEGLEQPPTPALLDLHARSSHFALEHLALSGQLLTPAELLSVLRLVPTLRTLMVCGCACVSDELFEMLSANEPFTTPLPQLRRLEICPITSALDGNIVVTMAESLFENANNGDPSVMFPSLIQLCLYRGDGRFVNGKWKTFAQEVEHRIAALRETGFRTGIKQKLPIFDREDRRWWGIVETSHVKRNTYFTLPGFTGADLASANLRLLDFKLLLESDEKVTMRENLNSKRKQEDGEEAERAAKRSKSDSAEMKTEQGAMSFHDLEDDPPALPPAPETAVPDKPVINASEELEEGEIIDDGPGPKRGTKKACLTQAKNQQRRAKKRRAAYELKKAAELEASTQQETVTQREVTFDFLGLQFSGTSLRCQEAIVLRVRDLWPRYSSSNTMWRGRRGEFRFSKICQSRKKDAFICDGGTSYQLPTPSHETPELNIKRNIQTETLGEFAMTVRTKMGMMDSAKDCQTEPSRTKQTPSCSRPPSSPPATANMVKRCRPSSFKLHAAQAHCKTSVHYARPPQNLPTVDSLAGRALALHILLQIFAIDCFNSCQAYILLQGQTDSEIRDMPGTITSSTPVSSDERTSTDHPQPSLTLKVFCSKLKRDRKLATYIWVNAGLGVPLSVESSYSLKDNRSRCLIPTRHRNARHDKRSSCGGWEWGAGSRKEGEWYRSRKEDRCASRLLFSRLSFVSDYDAVLHPTNLYGRSRLPLKYEYNLQPTVDPGLQTLGRTVTILAMISSRSSRPQTTSHPS
ncbi:hypothetical protein R3P38DRAFT_3469788 [Favolaschia claudopus]|uniref:F-box domain-containing protein n=1 Tax=Favolaschia claudopus TaxID=2862362 RepID=A0AAW0CKK9_9AGAR